MFVSVISSWEDADHEAMAALGYGDVLDGINPAHVACVVTAQRAGQVIGWLVLVGFGPGVLGINPGDLGGHSVVRAGEDADYVGAHMLGTAQTWARSVGLRRLELWFPMIDEQADDAHVARYAAVDFSERLRYVSMVRDLPQQAPQITLPTDVTLEPLRAWDRDVLYAVYLAAFGAGNARFFVAQDEEERRAFFDTLGWESALDHPASMVLRSGGQVAGFAMVLPDGERDHLISCMCVAPAFQGRGLGRLLLDVIAGRVVEQGGRQINLGTEPQMRAYQLYVRSGFRVVSGVVAVAWSPPR